MTSVALENTNGLDLSKHQRLMITLAVMLVAIVEIIDMTIVNVSLPQMMGELGTNSEQVTWILTSYIVASAIFMPLTGFLVKRIGRRRLLLINITGFLASSICCGLSSSLSSIVLFRTLQGSFGAGLVPLSQYILRDSYPKEEYGKAMAIWGLGIMTAPVIGPTLGGYLTEVINWRWIFFINIPVCIVAIMMTLRYISESPREKIFIDWFGMFLMTVGIGCLQIFLDRGNIEDWFSSKLIWGLTIIWVATLSLFIIRGMHFKKNIIDFSLFKDRTFLVSELLLLMFCVCVIGLISIEPILFENIMAYSSIQAGLIMAPGALANAVTLVMVSSVMERVGYKKILATGLLIVAYASTLMGSISIESSRESLMLYGIIQGIGMGFFFVPLATLAFSTLPEEHTAQASGLFSFARSLGASMGISLLSTFINRHTQMHWSQLGEHIQAYNPNLQHWLNLRAWQMHNPMALQVMSSELSRQAGVKSFIDAFMLIAWVTVAMIPLVFLLPSTSKNASTSPA